MKNYDAIIIGGGMVGLTLAALLIKNNFSVAVIEESDHQRDDAPYTARASAIHANSAKLFQALNCWQDMPHTPIEHMTIWDHTHQCQLTFDHDETAWIVENRDIIAATKKLLASVDFYTNCKPIDFAESLLTLNDHTTLKTDILIGADGAHSWVRQYLQIGSQQKSYEHKAIVAVIESELPHRNGAYQQFLKTGPVALLPLSKPNLNALVWSADNPISDDLMRMSVDDFSKALTEALDHKLGKLTAITARQQFPLVMRHAENYVAPNVALVGDAAHTIHPLAGLGVNLGLMDAAALSDILCNMRKEKKPLGYYRGLRKYARWRKAENTSIMTMMRFFKEIFAINQPMANILRSTAVNTLNQSDALKNYILKCAAGRQDTLPSFLKTQGCVYEQTS